MIDYSFKFDIASTWEIPADMAGRIDLIAMELYGSVSYTTVIRVANRIGMPFFARDTLRPVGNSERPTRDTWVSYGHFTTGMVTELPAGRKLLVPTLSSANAFLRKMGVE
jgi:hypothetical protein